MANQRNPRTLSLPDNTPQSGRQFNFCPSNHRARLLYTAVMMDGGRLPTVTSGISLLPVLPA